MYTSGCVGLARQGGFSAEFTVGREKEIAGKVLFSGVWGRSGKVAGQQTGMVMSTD
jgi:hypothetical protein